jgi:hypothetical protein
MVECPTCKEWLHEECLKDQILRKKSNTLGIRKAHKASGMKRKALGDRTSAKSAHKKVRRRKAAGNRSAKFDRRPERFRDHRLEKEGGIQEELDGRA